MKYFIFALILFAVIFSCDMDLWEPNLKYIIDGSGVANISYTHPMGMTITDTVALPWEVYFQKDLLIPDTYILSSDNGYLYIYFKSNLVAEGSGTISFTK